MSRPPFYNDTDLILSLPAPLAGRLMEAARRSKVTVTALILKQLDQYNPENITLSANGRTVFVTTDDWQTLQTERKAGRKIPAIKLLRNCAVDIDGLGKLELLPAKLIVEAIPIEGPPTTAQP